VARHDLCQPITIGDDLAIDVLVEPEQPGLMGEQLADRDVLLAGLRELRPVRADPLVLVQQAAGVAERQDHRREALRRRVDDDHRVAPHGSPLVRSRIPPHMSTTFSPSL
jgi:hypothetical protein